MDDDVYKLRMCFAAWWLQNKLGRDILVTYRFINRTRSIPLARHINVDQLRDCLNNQIGQLHFRPDELTYFNRLHHFDQRSPEFMEFMAQMKLPYVNVEARGDELNIHTTGPWPVSMWWEMKILYTISEMFYINWMKEHNLGLADVLAEGRKRRTEAIELLQRFPGLRYSEFGARRRFSKAWERETDEDLIKKMPNQLIGISDMEFARDYGVNASGTNAHERGMVYSSVYHDRGILYAHQKSLDDWWEIWGPELSIALTDLYGSEFFWRNFTLEQMKTWHGFRQDSGDPFIEIPRAIWWYIRKGLNLKEIREKFAIPSDGITATKAVEIYQCFSPMINVQFGIGSFWTNNLGLPNISMIVKALETDGCPLVKLSDNQAKALGDPAEIERIKQEVDYDEQFTEQPIY